LKADYFLRKSFHRLNIGRRPASLDFDILAFRPPEFSEFFPERRAPGLPFIVALGSVHQHT
jgi:hypothetical protein